MERESRLIRTVLSNPNDDNVLPHQGKQCNLFARLAFGDNEPQTSRIIRMRGIMRPETEVAFRTSFSLELRDDLESNTALHVEIRDQAVVGANELGRVVFKVGDILDEIHFSEVKVQQLNQERNDLQLVPTAELYSQLHRWGGPTSLLGRKSTTLNAAEEQVVRMMSRQFRNDPRREKDELEKVGFKPHRLSQGGAVWLAFAQLP
jgi:phage gpG-like protein